MPLVVYANPSGGTYPGHMAVGEEPHEGDPSYFGYRFDPSDLPPDFRDALRWREYLFENTVPGNVVDETAYVRTLMAGVGDGYYTKRAECSLAIVTVVPPADRWRGHALYSFNPDDFNRDEAPCYNCVSWATVIGNRLVAGFLNPVRHGRVKEIVLQLQPVPPPQEPNGD